MALDFESNTTNGMLDLSRQRPAASSMFWDTNSWNTAAEIAVAGRRNSAAWLTPGVDNTWLSTMGTATTETPLTLRDAAAREAAAQQPQLLLKTAIEPDQRADKGSLILAVMRPWFDIAELIAKDPNAAYQFTPDQWEEIVAGAYKAADFDEVTLTPRSGDYGRDVIAIKNGIGRVRVVDQVKAYRPDNLVGAEAVRALMGILQTDGASKGFITTTSDFAPMITKDPLITPLIPQRLELINGQMLFARLGQLAKKRPQG
jgi:restriction system protein